MNKIYSGSLVYSGGMASYSGCVCFECDKTFQKTPEWVYKRQNGKKQLYFCSYSCMRKFERKCTLMHNKIKVQEDLIKGLNGYPGAQRKARVELNEMLKNLPYDGFREKASRYSQKLRRT